MVGGAPLRLAKREHAAIVEELPWAHGPLRELDGAQGARRLQQRRGEQLDVVWCEAEVDQVQVGEDAVLRAERGAQPADGEVAQRFEDGADLG